MDKYAFSLWFRDTARRLGLGNVKLRFMLPHQELGELGRYDPVTNTIFINENQSLQSAMHTALHEFAHAIVFKRNSEHFIRKDDKVFVDENNPLANLALQKLSYKGGHGKEWQRVASRLGVNIYAYVDKEKKKTPFEQIREALLGK